MSHWDWFTAILIVIGTGVTLYGAFILIGIVILPIALIFKIFSPLFGAGQAATASSDDDDSGSAVAKTKKKSADEWPPHHEYYFPTSKDEAEGANSPYWSD